jgi:hypothetical protein
LKKLNSKWYEREIKFLEKLIEWGGTWTYYADWDFIPTKHISSLIQINHF